MLRRTLRLPHELGAIGVMGSLAACLVLVLTAPQDSLVAYAAHRQGIAAITKCLLAPSLAVSEGAADPLLRTEWMRLWTILALSLANIVLAVWRPRLRRRVTAGSL